MKTYIVTETFAKNNNLSRTWVCTTKESAEKCLKERYDIACICNRIAGKEVPTDCLEYGFFFWELDGITMKYIITDAEIFEN